MRSGIRAAVPVIKRRPAAETGLHRRSVQCKAGGGHWPAVCMHTEGLQWRALYRMTAAVQPYCSVVLVVRLLGWSGLALVCVRLLAGLACSTKPSYADPASPSVPFRPYLQRIRLQTTETRHCVIPAPPPTVIPTKNYLMYPLWFSCSNGLGDVHFRHGRSI